MKYGAGTELSLALLGTCMVSPLFRHQQEVTKRCYLSWLTNSTLVYEPKCGGGGVVVFQPMSTAVNRSLNNLWRSYSIFNLWSPE